MQGFIGDFVRVQRRLAELLDTKFIPGQKDQITGYIFDLQRDILNLHREEKYRKRNYHLFRLKFLAKHLEEVKMEKEDLFVELREELKRQDHDNYFGTRFEIDIAASLIRKGIAFEHPDPPDFEIRNSEVNIECQSGHFSGANRTIREKIEQSVSAKSGKFYYNSKSALFIDITNIFFNSARRERDPSNQDFKEWVKNHMKVFDLDIGSVILFAYVADTSKSNPNLTHSYLRIDNEDIDDDLADFLDANWSESDLQFSGTFYPSEP